ncbi:hypothetical protein G9A89_004430 [Geosiphon pyriformis]|nr:hypothetical protein G9A89_004430 [Geosiphon pyriformis]
MSVVDQTRHLIAQTNQQENYKFCPNWQLLIFKLEGLKIFCMNIHFPKSDCVLRPKVSDVVMVSPNTGHKYRALHMICNTCGHTQEADPLDHRVSRTEFRPFGRRIVSRALIHDLTVRRRKPEICKNCDEMTIAVELHTRHADSMKL